MFCGGGG
ncbi:hypothetical protein YPPY98_2589, partial [Yersinia pestis PY-98]